jgi:hypothetical protein
LKSLCLTKETYSWFYFIIILIIIIIIIIITGLLPEFLLAAKRVIFQPFIERSVIYLTHRVVSTVKKETSFIRALFLIALDAAKRKSRKRVKTARER